MFMGSAIQIVELEAPKPWLELSSQMAFEEWVVLGRRLCAFSQVTSWYIGDWWAFGEAQYGQRAALAAQGVFGKSFQTLANSATVCRTFQAYRRRETLSFAHHAEVASLPQEHADELLNHAEQRGWSKGELRERVTDYRMAKVGLIDQAAQDPDYAGCIELVRLWNRVSPAARKAFLGRAKKAGEASIESDVLARWSDAERKIVRDAVAEGQTFDEVRALLPKRSVKGVMWVYYGERAMLDDYEEPKSAAEEDAHYENDARAGSAALYMALLQHHPEIVLGQSSQPVRN